MAQWETQASSLGFTRLKQFGAERTGTNVLHVICRRAFGFRPLTNQFGSKHHARKQEFDADVGFLVSIRDPYAWLESYLRWLPGAATMRRATEFCERWNYRYADWLSIDAKVVVKHEELLVDPAPVVERIAERFGFLVVGEVRRVENVVLPAERVSRDRFDHDRQIERRYLEDLQPAFRDAVTRLIDWELVAEFYGPIGDA